MRDGSRDGDGNSLYSQKTALTAFIRASELLSAVNRYTDFIRRLPVHLAKRILGKKVLRRTEQHLMITAQCL